MIPGKKIFILLTLILAINVALLAVTEKDNNVITLKLLFKIPTISEKHNIYILPKDKLKYTDKGDILVLSRKYCHIYRFDSKGQYTGSFLRNGKGPRKSVIHNTLPHSQITAL